MEEFEDLIPKYKNYIIIGIVILAFLFIIVGIFFYFTNEIKNIKEEDIEKDSIIEADTIQTEPDEYMIDIKGEVKKPGVYTLNSDKRVIDAVKEAGGFTNDADTSVNNLSMKLKDEMVIIIYSKKQINDFVNAKKEEDIKLEKCTSQIQNDSCITKESVSSNIIEKNEEIKTSKDKSKEENIKISINTASKSELMTLSGIGESKANAIIEYRKQKKFETPEDIKNVSGIGDSIFEKIKDSITT